MAVMVFKRVYAFNFTFFREAFKPLTFQDEILTHPSGVFGKTKGSGMVVLVNDPSRMGILTVLPFLAAAGFLVTTVSVTTLVSTVVAAAVSTVVAAAVVVVVVVVAVAFVFFLGPIMEQDIYLATLDMSGKRE